MCSRVLISGKTRCYTRKFGGVYIAHILNKIRAQPIKIFKPNVTFYEQLCGFSIKEEDAYHTDVPGLCFNILVDVGFSFTFVSLYV